ncbi:MAG: hypothetical protein O2954_00905 [bacterium]|nr:hypothetical protein [bacterium]
MKSEQITPLHQAAAELLLAWARAAAPHYGPTGSMGLDLLDFPTAEGPSYYNQFAHYAYLLLSEGVVPGATDEERTRFREIALKNLQYILSITDAEFHTPHYSRGRDWGRMVGEWSNFFQLRSLQLMETFDVGNEDLRNQISRTVHGAVEQLVTRFQSRFKDAPIQFPGNHATWHGLLFFEAGQYFKQTAWVDFAHDFFARYILPTQRPNGVWPEGEGIVVNYSMVTAQAVSLYAEAASSKEAQESMGRALGFFNFFSFPDGSSSVACDCRMRYHARPMVFLPPGFLQSTAGRQLCLERIQGYIRSLQEEKIKDNGAQGLAFYAASAHAIFEWTHAENTLTEISPEDVPAGRISQDSWTTFSSWQLIPELPNRFILDTQNFIELYHKESGYLLGAGNSKYMPRFSTLRRTSNGRNYIPDHAECTERTSTKVITVYTFDKDRIQITLSVEDNTCQIGFLLLEQHSDATYEAGLMLPFKPGETIDLGGVPTDIAPLKLIRHTFGPNGFSWRNRPFRVPEGATLDYPLVPHNPYTQHGLPAEDDYTGRLSFPIEKTEKLVIIT